MADTSSKRSVGCVISAARDTMPRSSVERLRSNQRLSAALAAITAVVVGVMAYLAVWFALNLLFGEAGFAHWGALRWPALRLASLDWLALGLSAIAFVLLLRLHLGLVQVVLGMAALGVVAKLGLGW